MYCDKTFKFDFFVDGSPRPVIAQKRRFQQVLEKELVDNFDPDEEIRDNIGTTEPSNKSSQSDDFLNDDENIDDIDLFMESDDEFIFEIAASLYGSKYLTIKKAEEVMKLLESFSKRCTFRCSELISDCKTVNDARNRLTNMKLYDFSDYTSEHKFKNKLINNDLYVEPLRITIGHETIQNQPGSLENIEHHAVSNNLKFQLRKFLEIDSILETILDNQDILSRVPEGTIKHFVNGKSWKDIVEKYPGKTLMPLFCYNDDFQVDNQLGSHSGTNALSMFYFSIPTLPSHLVSKLDSILTGMAVKSADIKQFSNSSPLHTLVYSLTGLEVDGLTLFAGSAEEQQVHVVTCKVLGDNLGLHAMFGYKQTFVTDKPCVTCETPLEILRYSWTVNQDLLRTVQKYENYFRNGTYDAKGLKERSVLNKLPSFHVIENLVADIMHDIQLGIGKFSMQHVLSYFITHKYFSIEALNNRIKLFKCGRKEAANKPGRILESHLTNGLHTNANESLFLLRYLPIIIFELVPFDDPIYLYLLDTIDMVEACFVNEFTVETIFNLNRKISNNRKMYLDLFETHLKFKDHNLLHYPKIIENSGPLKFISSIRFEAKHQAIKAYTNNSNNRRNICYSVCKKQGFEFAYFLLKGKDKYISKITMPSSNKVGSDMKVAMKIFMTNNQMNKSTYTSGL